MIGHLLESRLQIYKNFLNFYINSRLHFKMRYVANGVMFCFWILIFLFINRVYVTVLTVPGNKQCVGVVLGPLQEVGRALGHRDLQGKLVEN